MTYNKKAFTLIEIMIVVAIVAVIVAIAVPNYLRTGKASAKQVCINNLKQIDGAIDRWTIENGTHQGAVISDTDETAIYSNIDGGKPKCPSKGEYKMNAVGAEPQVTCTREDEGHKLPE